MDVFAAVVTLFLIMDPLGNILLFLSVLKNVAPERRRVVLIREIFFAYLVLLAFLFAGRYLLQFLGLDQETISIAGGIVLFLIALRMIFPSEGSLLSHPARARADCDGAAHGNAARHGGRADAVERITRVSEPLKHFDVQTIFPVKLLKWQFGSALSRSCSQG